MQNLLIYLGVGSARFNSELWQKYPNRRRCFVKHLIDSQMTIGMTEKQVVELLGIERKVYSHGVWSYHIPTLTMGKGKRYLNIYFDKNNIVTNIRIKIRTKLHK